MATRQPRYSKQEAWRRGTEWYRTLIRPKLGPESKGKYVAIDIETGEYEIADDSMPATHALLARNPDAEIWMERVGHRASVSFGGGPTEDPEW